MVSRADVEGFLAKVKDSVRVRSVYYPERNKNREALNELGLSPVDRTDFILNLSADWYHSGPERDRAYADNEIWVFGSAVDDTEIYIKLAVVEKYGIFYCKCLSFHKSERPLNYPLRSAG